MAELLRAAAPRTGAAASLLVVAGLLLIGGPARGDELMAAPTTAVGGATRVLARDNSVLDTNPAAMSLESRYSVEVAFQYYGRLKSRRLSSSAMDSRTSTFALGVGYSIEWWEPPFDPAVDLSYYDASAEVPRDKRRTHRISIAASQALLQRRINIGVGARILRYDHDIRPDEKKFTLDVGGAFLLAPNVAVFVVANNLVPTRLESDPITLSSGLGVNFGPLRAEADAVIDFTSDPEKVRVDLNAGAEVKILQQIAVSGGYRSERGFLDSYVSWGVGWMTPRFGITYAMRIEVGAFDHRTREGVDPGWDRLLHSVSVQVSP